MSFLENLPCRNPDSFKTTVEMQKRYHGHITRSLGQGRDYLPLETDTTPPSSQGMYISSSYNQIQTMSTRHSRASHRIEAELVDLFSFSFCDLPLTPVFALYLPHDSAFQSSKQTRPTCCCATSQRSKQTKTECCSPTPRMPLLRHQMVVLGKMSCRIMIWK